MEKFKINIPKPNTKVQKILLITAFFLIAVGVYIYYSKDYVIIRFDELGALTKNMSVYYNGFKVGKIASIDPDKDFRHTIARINLFYKNLNLPQNTTVKVESFPNGELYLQFVYPDTPSLKIIKRGDLLEGIAQYNIEEFMLGQNVSGVSDIVSIHVIKALNAMDLANKEMEAFFHITSDFIKAKDPEIQASTKNIAAMTKSFAQMAENLNQASKKINNSLDEKDLKNTTSNIKDTTDNIAKATTDIDKTIKKIDDTITNVNTTAENLVTLTGGLNQTMSKRFGGMRIIFGTPVKQKCRVRNCCN